MLSSVPAAGLLPPGLPVLPHLLLPVPLLHLPLPGLLPPGLPVYKLAIVERIVASALVAIAALMAAAASGVAPPTPTEITSLEGLYLLLLNTLRLTSTSFS